MSVIHLTIKSGQTHIFRAPIDTSERDDRETAKTLLTNVLHGKGKK